jgi:P-type Mg2+ transporter
VPFSPIGAWFGFRPPPIEVTASIGLLVVAYLICAELVKRWAIGSPAVSSGVPLARCA